ncbi:beta-lactamase family protein [Acinetobacter sp. 187]|uniref:serine hydrolase domain-containing protein n=1 Tax=Acinetobacter lanii TaxID=2715163 RepID=UPI00140D7039|nr:serine hydrolase domain-containing protein [Acinetobacter lanii]NHC03958.1 beta-lactamase family protein [Acinetobacter lanii]
MNSIAKVVFANTQNYMGEVDPRFIDLAKQFSRLQDQRSHLGGAALVVYFRGEKVVDIYTGQKSSNELWAQDTLSICYSTGKGVLATLAHILVSQGMLDYDQPIADYWPEFAQNGKDKMTLRHVLSHQSGLFDIRNIISKAAEMADWQHMLKVMENAQPRFNIGQENAYQALTFGWLVGGVLEKATQKSLTELMQQYLVEPLELDGAYFGVPQSELARVAKPLPKPKVDHQSNNTPDNKTQAKKSKQPKFNFSEKLIEWSGQDPQDFLDAMVPKRMREFSFFDDASIQAIIPAANGAFTARSLAKVYAMLANRGEWHGQSLIDAETFKTLAMIQNNKRDRVMPIPMKWRLGYHRVLSMGKRAKQGFGHIGYNGSGAWCDPERELSFAYTHNFTAASITGDYRLWGLTQETLRCADAVLKGHKGWF